MFYIITAIILLLLSVAGFAARGAIKREFGEVPLGMFLIFPAILVVFTLFFSFTTVDARAVGIQTGFGRYHSTMDNGLHFKAPWTSVEEFSTLLQSADLEGEEGVDVTFKGGGSGTVNATFRWSISDDQSDHGAKALWEKYRTFENVSSMLVYREGKDTVLNVANDYTPNEARTKQDVIGAEIKKRMSDRLSEYGIVVDSVSVLSMPLDAKTQASLDKVVSSQNDVERAKADRERAKIDNETIKLREKSGALTPEANQRYCLELVNAWDVSKNGNLPATFDCSLSSDGKPVIVNGGK